MIDRTGLREAIRRAVDSVSLMQRVADEAMTLVEGAEGVLVGLVHGEWLTFECGAGYLEEQIGNKAPLRGKSLRPRDPDGRDTPLRRGR